MIEVVDHSQVIKGHSSASAEVEFTPVVMETGDGSIYSYILGRVSITSDSVSYTSVSALFCPTYLDNLASVGRKMDYMCLESLSWHHCIM